MTTLVQISANQSAKEVTANENLTAVSIAGAFGKKHTTTTLSGGLTFGYYGGTINVDGTLTAVSDGTVALQAAGTNYVQRDRVGTVTTTTAGFVPGYIPLWEITTSANSAITGYTDRRTDVHPQPSVHTNIGTVSMTSSSYTMSAAEWRNDILWVVGSAGALIVPTVKKRYGVTNNCALQTLVKTSAGSGIVIAASRHALVYCDGTHVRRETADSTYSS